MRSVPLGRAPGKPSAASSSPSASLPRPRAIQKVSPTGGRKTGVIVVGKGKPSGRRTAPVTQDEASSNECLIGPSTDIKAAAGYVCAVLRGGGDAVVRAISPSNVNQALKTLALAHAYLAKEGTDIYAHVDLPEYASAPRGGNVALYVFQKSRRTSLAKVNQQIYVSGTSEPPKVGGYISECVRQASLGRICVTACGPQAVLNSLKAIFLARHNVRPENIEISIVPEFGHSADGLSLVNIFCLAHRIGAAV